MNEACVDSTRVTAAGLNTHLIMPGNGHLNIGLLPKHRPEDGIFLIDFLVFSGEYKRSGNLEYQVDLVIVSIMLTL